MTKRYNITVTDWQADALEEIALAREVSVSNVVRDALRTQLPRDLQLVRFLQNPSTSPDLAISIVEGMERLELEIGEHQFEREGDAARIGSADEAALPPRTFKRSYSPPDGNTGAHE